MSGYAAWKQLRLVKTFTVALGLAIALTGCGSQSTGPPTESQSAGAASTVNSDEPRTVTDLSQISPGKAMPAPIPQLNSDSSTTEGHSANSVTQQNIERLFVSNVNQL